MDKFTVAAIQMDSQQDIDRNLSISTDFIEQAVEQGAKLIALPENMNYIGPNEQEYAELVPNGKTYNAMSKLAKKHGVWLHCGSIYELNTNDARPYNCTMLINPNGELAAKYHKIHPFDVAIANGATSKESRHINPGNNIVTVDTKEVGNIGLSICYDIRFPEIFRIMALQGAEILMAPANFTLHTGKDHWEVLLSARAIENECYVIAPAQYGVKSHFQAYGNSLIIDPWGTVIARASNQPGIITAQIDLNYLKKVRNQTFALANRRPDIYQLSQVK